MTAQQRKKATGTAEAKDLCDVEVFDPGRVAAARETMPPNRQIDDLASVFQCLAQPTRVKIIHALFIGELCVCDLAQILGVSVSAVSHQLRLLRSYRLVKFRRQGKMAYYSIDDEHVRSLLALGLDHVRHG